MKMNGIDYDLFGLSPKLFGRTVYREEFRQQPLLNASVLITDTAPTLAQMALRLRANRDWEIAGTNAAVACVAFADGGGVVFTTTTTASDQVILQAHQDTSQSALAAAKFNTLDKPAFVATIKTGSSIAATTIWMGFKLTSTGAIATDDNQAYFRYEPSENGGYWQAITSRSGTDTTTKLNEGPDGAAAAVAASTTYRLAVVIDQDRRPLFYVNDQLLYTGDALTTNIDLIPFIGVQTGAAAAKSLTIRSLAVSKDQND